MTQAIPPGPPDLGELTAEILARCEVLALATEEPGRLTRTFLSPPMHQVHALLAGWMADAGMTVRLDAAGNLIGRYVAEDDEADTAPAILIGSHLDTVPDAGKFDGMLGVLLGVAAVRALREADRRLSFAIEVVGFSEEEGVRYRTPYLGSLALAGQFDPALLNLTDASGVLLADACRRFGLDPDRIGDAAAPPGRYLAYLEAHIEQGPVLEVVELPVGVVSAIAGQSRLSVTFEGRAGHAGTTPMEGRVDALPAAAELVLAVESLARSVDGLRGTVGSIQARPGASNVIPGSVTLSLDIRHPDDSTRMKAVDAILAKGDEIADNRGLNFETDRRVDHPAVPADPALTDRLAQAVQALGIEPLRLDSGAGHDAAVLGAILPMTMLFVRSPGGISHHPDERVDHADVAVALDVIGRWLADLASSTTPGSYA